MQYCIFMTDLTALSIAALESGRRYTEHVHHAGPEQNGVLFLKIKSSFGNKIVRYIIQLGFFISGEPGIRLRLIRS